jgi:hypothetical protein
MLLSIVHCVLWVQSADRAITAGSAVHCVLCIVGAEERCRVQSNNGWSCAALHGCMDCVLCDVIVGAECRAIMAGPAHQLRQYSRLLTHSRTVI